MALSQLRKRLVELSFCLVECCLIVSRVKLNKQLSSVHHRIVVNMNRADCSIYACRDWIQMSVYLSVVRFLESKRIQVPCGSTPDQNEQDDGSERSSESPSIRYVCFGFKFCLEFSFNAHLSSSRTA